MMNTDGSGSASLETTILHLDRRRDADGAVHAPVHPSVPYGHPDTETLIAVFQQSRPGFTYARQTTPTNVALEAKVSLLEGARDSIVFATGMGAISATFFSLLAQGSHVVCSRHVFGNTSSLLRSFTRFGVAIDFIDATSAENVAAALRPATRLVFVETIANPGTEVADLEGIFALGLGECDVAPATARSAGLRNWVLLLDGLDEAASEQANVISGLIGFAQGFPEARVVVTTRPVGYRRGALATWRHYELTLEGRERAANQMTRLLKHILPQDDVRRPHLQRLTEEALERSEAAKAASRSPLMLALSAALFAHGEDLGRTRLAFYRAIFELLEAEPPPRAGAPPAGLPVLRRVLDALGWILTETPLALKEKVLAACACALRPEIGGAALAVEELVGRCVDYWEALGVVEQLHHGAQNVVTFVHKTFGEFAAGRWIAGLPPEAQAEILGTRADLDAWREPVAFAAALGAGELVLQQLTRRGFSGAEGQARLIQALEILAEADPPLHGEAADAAYAAALARLDEDHRTWAFATGLALTALGRRLPGAVLNDVLTRLHHPQIWTRACAWSVGLAADPNRFNVDDLCKAVADVAGEAGATNRRSLGGAYVVGAADRAVVEAFCIGVAEVVLARHEPSAADEIIHANLRQKGVQTIGFAIRMERLLAAHGLKYRWRDLAGVGRRAMDFALPADAERWQREGFSGIVAGLSTGVPPGVLKGEGARYLYVLAALFELIGFRQSGVSEIYHFQSQKVAAAAPDVWRALARLADLPLDRLSLEARAFLDVLEAGEADSLSLVFDRLPTVDLPEPRWGAARGIVDLQTVAQALSLPSEILATAALKLVLAAATPEEVRDLSERLLEDRRGWSVWAACSLVQRLPREEALERLCQSIETGGGDHNIYSALALLGLTDESRHLNVLTIGLMGNEPYVAIAAAKALSQVAPAAALSLARDAYEHWLRHEEPYPEADGVVPPSPRDILLRLILEGSDAPIDEVVAYVADRRVSTVAQKHFIARLQSCADVREAVALQIASGRLPVAVARAALREVEGWSPGAVASMVTLLDAPEGALRLAALPLLRSPHLEEGERLRRLAILRHDAEPEIREAVIAMIPQLGVGSRDCFAC